jgi:hypothetical protein
MQTMKLSKFWFDWSRSAMVLVLTLGFFGWTPIPASAAVEYNERISFIDDFDACSGERVSIAGIQHIVGRVTKDAMGKFHFGFTRNTKGTGVGQISGDKYILTDAVGQMDFEFVSGQPRILTQEYHSVFIHKGEAFSNDDTIIHFLSKLTVKANGEITTAIEIQNVECR